MTIADLITGACFEIRVARAGDVLAPELMAFGLQLANELIDAWNAVPDRRGVYSETFANYTLVPSLSPHTIGPTGTFVVPSRPVSLEFASVNLLGGPPNVYRPVRIISARQYANKGVPDLTMQFPTEVYYEPTWPNGSLYFCPVPTQNFPVRLWTRTLLGGLTLAEVFSMPPGYESAFRLTLAEMLAPAFGQTVSASTTQRAKQARATIFANNEDTPRLRTADAGLGTSSVSGSAFNWLDRSGG